MSGLVREVMTVEQKTGFSKTVRRPRHGLYMIALLTLGTAAASPLAAQSPQVLIRTEYTLRIAGLHIADFNMEGDFASAHYSLSGSGKSASLARLISKFKGWTKSDGTLNGGTIVPASYALDFRIKKKRQSVDMHLNQGKVAKLDVFPPVKPSDTRIPVTSAHQTGVLDPISAVVIPLPKGQLTNESACNRTLPIFDGRQRYDLVLSAKRVANLPAANGSGTTPVHVCKIKYVPIAGHKPERESTQYWADNEDMEIWLAAVQSAKVLIPYRVVMPTPLGEAVVNISKLEVSGTQQAAAQ